MTRDEERAAEWVRQVLYFDTRDEPEDLDTHERFVEEVRRRHHATRRYHGWRRVIAAGDTRRLVRLMRVAGDPASPATEHLRHRSPRLRWWVGVSGLVAVLGAGSLAYALWPSEQASNPTGVLCHAQSDADGDRAGIEFVDDPIEACAVLWTDGTFATDGPPPLVGCVNDFSLATVLPGEAGLCAELGWPDLEPGVSAETEAVAALNHRVIDEINLQPCAPADQVLVEAELLLAESGLDGWTVAIGEGWHDAECAKVAVDPPSRSLTVSGI